MSAICIIPARGGSVRIPRKNIRPFMGKPIIHYAIEAAKQAVFDEVIVSTDDDEIAEVAGAAGANIWRRPTDNGSRGTQALASDILERLTIRPTTACVLYPCSPLLSHVDLIMSYRLLLARKGFVMSVGAEPLRDAGCFYWGWTTSFIWRRPLISQDTTLYVLPEERVCDINTEDDWAEAETKYLRLHGDPDDCTE